MSELNKALTLLPDPLRSGVAARWRDFIEAAQRQRVAPPTESAILDQLIRVWACSDFVARSCAHNPTLIKELLDRDDLFAGDKNSKPYSLRFNNHLANVEDQQQLKIALRRVRRQEMVRIAWRDLAGLASLEETLVDLSNLADAALETALQKLYVWQCRRFGVPRDTEGQAQQLVILGMGKLGGGELNFSSDIDLIFSFPSRGKTEGQRRLSNEEFFRRLGQQLIGTLEEPTPEGFVFRVDMRLRPFGDSGPLVMPFNALEDYYQNHGREWERYAMIKARVVAGDRMAGERLLSRLRPFVYRRYLDYGAFESLHAMKTLIAREVERKGLRRNIKLGPGGIREIEFIGQTFQLIYGGREPALRERSILRVLDYLAETDRLPLHAVCGLKEAYHFLRRTENRLQAWADQQTHNLPQDEMAKLRLAFAMGFSDWEAFVEVLKHHVGVVSGQFEQIFASPKSKAKPVKVTMDFAEIWSGAVDEEGAIQFLKKQGFDDPNRAWKCLQDLRRSYDYRSLSKQSRERMDKLMPLMLNAVATISAASTTTLERVVPLLEAVAKRSVYLVLLIENPMVLSQLVKLCAASLWISKYLARYPLLLDDLLDPTSLYQPPDRSSLPGELSRYLERVVADDTEQMMDALRHFKHTHVLRVAAADVNDAIPLMVVSDHLTELAEVLLRKVLELAWMDLLPRYGRPCYVTNGQLREANFAIVAYGKLGGIELNYGSDLDLVFLHDSNGASQQTNGSRQLDNATFFARLVQRIIYWLTTRTAAGELYQVDTRLRPSGRSGLLVSSMQAFAEYQRHQAWTWEHQALARARVVAGPISLSERFNAIRREVLSRERDPVGLRHEVRKMRERMRQELGTSESGYFHLKQDQGGIADIEFMVQYAVLANAHRYPDLLTYTDNIRQLDGLERFGIMTCEDATLLRDAYRTLRRRLHLLTLQEQPCLIPDNELWEIRQAVVSIWQESMEHD